MRPGPLFQQNGYTLVELAITTLVVGILALTAYEVINMSLKAKNSTEATLELSGLISALANPKANQAPICTPLTPSGRFDSDLAQQSSGMEIQIELQDPKIIYAGNRDIPGTPLRLNYVRYADAVMVGTDPNGFTMWAGTLKFQAQLQKEKGSAIFQESYGGSAFVTIVDAGGNLQYCELINSQNTCQKIGGNNSSGTCVLPAPTLECSPDQVAYGYDGASRQTLCRPLTWHCDAGFVAAGFDPSTGNVKCIAISGGAPPPPPPPSGGTCYYYDKGIRISPVACDNLQENFSGASAQSDCEAARTAHIAGSDLCSKAMPIGYTSACKACP